MDGFGFASPEEVEEVREALKANERALRSRFEKLLYIVAIVMFTFGAIAF